MTSISISQLLSCFCSIQVWTSDIETSKAFQPWRSDVIDFELIFVLNLKHAIKYLLTFNCISTGGEEVLIEYAGKEATEAFDDVGHSQDAKDILKNYHVGTIVEAERMANKKKKEETKK